MATEYFHAYGKAPYENSSKEFRLTVEGQPVDVVTYFDGQYEYAHIAYEGEADFEVKSLYGPIDSYNLSPHSYKMTGTVSGDTLKFSLKQAGSRYVFVSIKAGNKEKLLAIAADPKLEWKKPRVDGEKIVDITQAPYQADATGEENVSPIIQKAIDRVSAAGGGMVYFPAGVYKFTYFNAADNVTIYLEEGAFLRGSGNRDDYEWNGSGSGNIHGRRNIDLKSAVNFAMVGPGVIDANSTCMVEPDGNGKKTGWCNYRKGIVQANGAKNITMEGITIMDATGWTFNICDSENIVCRNVKMLNDYDFVHSDGYDFVSCQGVLVEECLGICGDDVYCPKAGNGNREMKDYLFKNCVAYAWGGAGCKVGVQSNSPTFNIEFNNIDVVKGYRGISISHDEGNGDFNDIRFIDVRTEELFIPNVSDTGQYRAAPFIIWTFLRGRNERGNVSNIQVTRCTFEKFAPLKGIVQGWGPESKVTDVTFTDCTMDGVHLTEETYTDFVSHGENISNIRYI